MEQLEFWKRKYTETELAYFAGIIDGEGSISIPFHRGFYSLRLSIESTSRDLIEYLSLKYGGKIYNRNMRKRCDYDRKPQFAIHWCGSKASILIRLVKKYLLIKKPHIQLALDFADTIKPVGGKVCLSLEERRTRKQLFGEMKVINKRGTK